MMIEKNIIDNTKVKQVVLLDEVDSTNNYLKENYEKLKDRTLVVAYKQSSGRGRLSNKFISNGGSGLYFSLLSDDLVNTNTMTMISCVAIRQAIYELFEINLDIKWINDLLLNKRKVCGILSENIYEGNVFKVNITGIGINLFEDKDIQNQVEKYGYLFDEKINQEKLLIEIINKIDWYLSNVDDAMKIYLRYSNLVNKKILFKNKEDVTIINVNKDLSLEVISNGVIKTISDDSLFDKEFYYENK